MKRRAPLIRTRVERTESLLDAKPRSYPVPAAPSPGAVLALQLCRVAGCSHWSAPDAIACRRCRTPFTETTHA